MKQSLNLKISQHLTLTPQLQQSIRLLQLSTLELNQEIDQALLENPMLERADGSFDEAVDLPDRNALPSSLIPESSSENSGGGAESAEAGDSSQPDGADSYTDGFNDGMIDWSSSGGAQRSPDDEEPDFQNFQAAEVSLRDHLNEQVSLSPLSDRDRMLARLIIEALDDDGYLYQSLEDLLPLLPQDPEEPFGLEDLTIALRQVQSLEPTGVGARSLRECLLLQLRTLPETPPQPLACTIVADCLEWLAERNFAKLKKTLGCNDHALREAQMLICSLNPHPGSAYGITDTRYVVPDVTVKKTGNRWVVTLNQDAIPRLRVNALYAGILKNNRGDAGSLSSQLQEARWLIKNIQQRFDTILRVSQTIVDRQRAFFDYGEVAMRPLTLREIADELGLHESTISRVTTQKYMATPQGIIELKYFFGSHVATDTGGAASSTAIRALIRQLVDAENRKKPLSDAKIADLLGEQGIVVARRTVAKYRESLNIPPVSQRKEI